MRKIAISLESVFEMNGTIIRGMVRGMVRGMSCVAVILEMHPDIAIIGLATPLRGSVGGRAVQTIDLHPTDDDRVRAPVW